MMADRPVLPTPVGVIVIVPVYILSGVMVKLVEAVLVFPDEGPARVKVVANRVIVTISDTEVDTFPAASFAQAYRVFEPSVENVYVDGDRVTQPLSPASGGVELSVSK